MTGKHRGKKNNQKTAAGTTATPADMSENPDGGSLSGSETDETAAMALDLDALLDPSAKSSMDHTSSKKRPRSVDTSPSDVQLRKVSKGDLAATTTTDSLSATEEQQEANIMDTGNVTADILTRKDDRILPLIFSNIGDRSLIQFGLDLDVITGRLELKTVPMKKLPRGDIMVFPSNAESFNKLSKFIDNPVPLRKSFGLDVKVRFPAGETNDTKKRPKPASKLPQAHYVMVRSVSCDLGSEQDILEAIQDKYNTEEDGDVVIAIKRIHNKVGYPLPLVKLQVRSAQDIKNLVQDGLSFGYHHFKCELCRELPVPNQCDKCLVWGGHPTGRCLSPKRCIRCGSHTHPSSECPIAPEDRKCSNCGGNHIALYKGCKAYKDAQNRLIEQQKEKKTQKAAMAAPTGTASTKPQDQNAIPDKTTNQGSYSQAARSAVSTAAAQSSAKLDAAPKPLMKTDQAVELFSTLISAFIRILNPSLQVDQTLVQTLLLAVTPLLGELPADNMLARITTAMATPSQ